MKKNVIAVLLSVVLAAGSIGTVPVLAAETNAQESVSVREEKEAEEGTAQDDSGHVTGSAQEDTADEQEDSADEQEESGADLTHEDDAESEYIQFAGEDSDNESEQTTGKEPDEMSDETTNKDDQNEDEVADVAMDEVSDETLSDEASYDDEAAGEEDPKNTEDTSEEANQIGESQVIEEETEAATEEKNALAEEVVDSGTCGTNATWTLTGTGNDLTLTISGSGGMNYYDSSNIPWASKRSKIKIVNVEDGITSISSFAFYECGNLTSVTLPDSVTQIGDYAFYGCSNLTNVTLSENVSIIANCTFYGCSALASLKIPDKVKTINGDAFKECSSLKSIELPDELVRIDYNAFEGCSSLESITIPNGVTRLSSSTFSDCRSLSSITLPDGLTQIDYGAFYDCNSLTSIIIPDRVSQIDSDAFFNCSSLKSIVIPDGVSKISDGVFCGCSSLTSITIPNGVTQILSSAFSGCSSLKSIELPDGLTQIDVDAFSGCSSLTGITIPNSVTRIGEYAFANSGLTSITIPDKMTYIGDYVFYNCKNLKSVTIPDSVTSIGIRPFYECNSLTDINIPDTVTSIGEGAVSECHSLTSIRIPDGVTNIANSLFSGCKNMPSITIPDSVTRIEDYGFNNCSSLTSIQIPSKVTQIDYCAFSGCSSLSSITILDNVTTIDDQAFKANYKQKVDVYTIKGCEADRYFTKLNKEWKNTFNLHYLYDPTGTSQTIYPKFKKIVIETGDIVDITDYLILTDDTNAGSIEVTGYNSGVLFFDSGQLAALAAGNTNIKVTCGEETIKIPVSVVDKAEAVTGISFDSETMTMPFGGSANLILNLTPETATPGTVKWNSSDADVVSVDNGILQANAEGTASITATMTSDSSKDALTATCEVTVSNAATAAIIAYDEVTVERGEPEKLYYSIYPAVSDVTTPYEFESDDTDVVEVSADGVLSGKILGTTNVTIRNGNLSKTIAVTVKAKLRGISLDKKQVRIPEERTAQLKVIYDPEDTTDDRTVIWTSSNNNVATVDENGLVTAHSKGIVAITATVGGYSAKCSVVCVDSSTPISMTGIELPDDETMEYGTEFTPEVTYLPQDTTDDRTVTWKSGNTKIFKVSKEGVVTPTGIGSANLTAEVGDFSATMKITVIKGTPAYEKPKPVDAHCGQKLSDLELPAGFAWDDPDADVGSAGSNPFTVTFTPDDTAHYNKVEGISVLAKVEHAFADKWTVGSEQHWHECVCGEVADEAAHAYGSWKVTRKAGCEEPGQKERSCTVCGHKATEAIPATGHVWEEKYTIDVEPTYVEEGSESIHCSVCGQSEPGTERAVPKKDDPFSVDATFTVEKPAFNYTGNPIEPGVIVTYKGDQLEEGRDYSVAYSNNIDLGMANVDVYGMGEYSGVKHLQFKIRIGATKKVTCTNVASGMKVSWEKVNGATRYKVYRDGKLIFTTSALVVTDKEVKYNAGTKYVYKVVAYAKGFGDSDVFRTGTYYRLMPVGIKSLSNPSAGKMTVTYDKSSGSTGYVVRYGLKPEMTDAKVITVAGDNTLSRTFAGMKKGMTYYVQVRTYKLDNGVRYYSGYCTTKTIKITK